MIELNENPFRSISTDNGQYYGQVDLKTNLPDGIGLKMKNCETLIEGIWNQGTMKPPYMEVFHC